MNIFKNVINIFKTDNGADANEMNGYLTNAKSNIKQAYIHLNRFLGSTSGFVPARRHEEFYYVEVRDRLKKIKSYLFDGNALIDYKLKGMNEQPSRLKSIEELKKFVDSSITTIRNDNAELDNGVIKKLQTEMWSEERKLRGFPVPKDKETLINSLEESRKYLIELSMDLENYNLLISSSTL
ncbi:MAG TPA: hypothetical protein VJG30_02340 [Candidatus Nanoarchaeia archaeon]|nr:hypothetical protein [Candidatus Nanoarchaeia archaeon]